MKTTILALILTTISLLAQGPLTPPNTPAPTMKTLAQIEARTPIPPSPAVPIAGPHFTIDQPGSYYLTGNLTVTDGDAIRITASSDVSIDLNGFTIRSTLTGTGNGRAIHCFSSFTRLTVKNGSLVSGSITPTTFQGFNAGIFASGTLREVHISHLLVRGMAGSGIIVNDGIVENCIVSHNGFYGITNGQGSVTNCNANNNAGDGISVGSGTVTNCNAKNNAGDGIEATKGAVNSCTATFNVEDGIINTQGIVTNSTASSNGADGISAIAGTVTNCRAFSNFKNGIQVDTGVVAHCVASSNSTDPATMDKEILVSASGQRDACVPATE